MTITVQTKLITKHNACNIFFLFKTIKTKQICSLTVRNMFPAGKTCNNERHYYAIGNVPQSTQSSKQSHWNALRLHYSSSSKCLFRVLNNNIKSIHFLPLVSISPTSIWKSLVLYFQGVQKETGATWNGFMGWMLRKIY